jgi:16S rRNA (uracil1498-N3)-methyltransferase
MAVGDLHRFYADDLGPAEVRLDEQEAHHAASVLRLKTGCQVELFDGRGGKAVGKISRAGRGGLVVTIERRMTPSRRPRPAVHLAFSTPKGRRLDWLLEKATELGAASLQAVIFERTVAGGQELTEAKARRWLSHCVAAAKQSGLDFLPELRLPLPLDDFLAASRGALSLLGDAAEDARPLPQVLTNLQSGQDVLLLVGPEGGLTEAERASALAAGFVPVRLGRTVLRIETAAVALLAVTLALGQP